MLEVAGVLAAVTVFALAVTWVLGLSDPTSRTGTSRTRRGGRRRSAPAPDPSTRIEADEADRPLPAVVVNPTKFDDLDAARRTITRACEDVGWSAPLWLETTPDDPGVGQAREAVRRGADVVMACGGDGTVRCVGEALAGTGVAMGLLPAGTGNLLARNLDMDLDDLAGATRTALTGDDRPIDVGRIAVDDGEEQVFLVMAGLGFDAQVMAHAPEALKAKVGPIAYTVSGLRNLKGEQSRVRIGVDDDEELRRRVRTVLIGNCGKLLGGLVLMPDAEVDDGWLDVVSIAPEGIIGWAAVAGHVITRQRKGHGRVEHWRGKAITVQSLEPQPAQLDGDPIGDVRSLRVRVDEASLLVRVPAGDPASGPARPGHA
ncbi:diacylglycerol kinase family protein [Thalassiella azotivora]